MSFARDTVRSSAQRAIYEVVRIGLAYVWITVAQPFLSAKARQIGVPGAVAWGFLASIVLLFGGFFVFDWWRSPKKPGPHEKEPTVGGLAVMPVIHVEATSGRKAMVTVNNTGDSFTLVTRARIIAASHEIDHAGIYQFLPRPVSGGDDVSGYTIATLDEGYATLPSGRAIGGQGVGTKGIVTVRGEQLADIQFWVGTGDL